MTPQDILKLRLFNEQLTKPTFSKPQEVVSHLGAVQSQDFPGAKWAVGQRLLKADDQTIQTAFDKGEILRTHLMRPTWHFVSPQDIRWLLKLTAPRVSKLMGHYNKLLDLNESVFSKSQKIIVKALEKHTFLTRQELKTYLTEVGIKTNVQRLAHIIMQAELDAIICSGPLKGKQFTYALLDTRVKKSKPLNQDESLKKLVTRYFSSHGPAQIQDFVWWSGLTTLDAKKGIELAKLDSETIDEKIYYFYKTSASPIEKKVYILPNYDEYTIAYRDRSLFYDPIHNPHLDSRGNSIFQNALIWEGQAIGLWKRTLKKDTVLFEYKFFQKPTSEILESFKEETKKYGEFLSLKVVLNS